MSECCFVIRKSNDVYMELCCAQLISCVGLFATPWTIAHQVPPSMGFCRQEYWSGLPCPPPGDLPNPGIKPRSPTLQADSLQAEPQGKPLCSREDVKIVGPNNSVNGIIRYWPELHEKTTETLTAQLIKKV